MHSRQYIQLNIWRILEKSTTYHEKSFSNELLPGTAPECMDGTQIERMEMASRQLRKNKLNVPEECCVLWVKSTEQSNAGVSLFLAITLLSTCVRQSSNNLLVIQEPASYKWWQFYYCPHQYIQGPPSAAVLLVPPWQEASTKLWLLLHHKLWHRLDL